MKPVLVSGRCRFRGGRHLRDRRLAGVQQDLVLVRGPQERQVHGGRRWRRHDALAQFVTDEKLKGKVGASGWDLGTPVVQAISAGDLTFTINQQPYLQGFDTIMQLFLYNVSGGLMAPTDTDTGLGIVSGSNVAPYLTANRFVGSSAGLEDAHAAGLDQVLTNRRRATGRSNASHTRTCCLGATRRGSRAADVPGAPGCPARLSEQRELTPTRDHDQALRLLLGALRLGVPVVAAASAPRPGMRARSARSPSVRCCC